MPVSCLMNGLSEPHNSLSRRDGPDMWHLPTNSQMPCSYCHEGGHNIRTCQKFDIDQIAQMIAEGEAKEVIFRGIDMGFPGAGFLCEVVDRAISGIRNAKNLGSATVNERKRAALGLLLNASSGSPG